MLKSKTISMRLVTEEDADFILSLRKNPQYNTFLSKVTGDKHTQVSWIRNYKHDEAAGTQFYFIIENNLGVPCGTVRIYDLRSDSFCWGSWILNEDKTRYAAIESAFLVYKFGFEHLGFTKSHFDVRKGNDKVISFHKKFGAVLVSEDVDNYYFEIRQENVKNAYENLRSVCEI